MRSRSPTPAVFCSAETGSYPTGGWRSWPASSSWDEARRILNILPGIANAGVFVLGDNVVIGANSVVMGPVDICDNVLIGAMSLVNRSIAEPGVYVGVPARKVSAEVSDEWVAHLKA